MNNNPRFAATLLIFAALGACQQAKPMRFDELKRCYAATVMAEAVLEEIGDKRGIRQIRKARSDIAGLAISAGKRQGWGRDGVVFELRSSAEKEVERELSNPYRSYQDLLDEARKRQSECLVH